METDSEESLKAIEDLFVCFWEVLSCNNQWYSEGSSQFCPFSRIEKKYQSQGGGVCIWNLWGQRYGSDLSKTDSGLIILLT